MKFVSPVTRIFIAVIVTIITLFSIGCEHFQAITYENKIASPVKVIIYNVPLSSTIIPKRTWNDPGDVIGIGESKTLVTEVSPNRNGGKYYYYYAVIAVTETDEIIISKIYTWDELHNANWKVVITTQH